MANSSISSDEEEYYEDDIILPFMIILIMIIFIIINSSRRTSNSQTSSTHNHHQQLSGNDDYDDFTVRFTNYHHQQPSSRDDDYGDSTVGPTNIHNDHHPQPSGDDHHEDFTVGTTNPGGSISVTLSDPDVLDCSICCLPLTIPVFQCENGHIACSSCRSNLGNTCPSCCGKIGYNRCRAIEKVIESVQVSSCNLRYGCRGTINYCKKQEHEETCIYTPCSCPYPDCLFRGPSRSLSTHMSEDHAYSVIRFRFDSKFSVFLEMDEKFLVLQEKRDGILFILSHGNRIAVRCVDRSLSKRRFSYDLVLSRDATSFKFQSFTHCATERFNDPPSVDYLVIPGYPYHRYGGYVKLDICIRSKEASASHQSSRRHYLSSLIFIGKGITFWNWNFIKNEQKMAKFSIFRDEEEDDDDFCIRSPKRRRISYSQTSSTHNHHQEEHQQSSGDEDYGNLPVGPTNSGGAISVTLSDPDVLDCSICFLPLTIPVFQCENGHIACSSCCSNLGNTCPSCCGTIGYNRCRAIEKVIESAQVSCCNLRYGCKETINYCKKHEHEETCIYTPCLCPYPGCLFRGPSRSLSTHMSKDHADSVIHFRYDSNFPVFLERDDKFLVLQEETDGNLFILSHGNRIAVRCVDPSLSNGRFSYDLALSRDATSFKFQSFTHCATGQFNEPPSADYFVIPGYLYNGGYVKLEICVRSKEASHHADIT
ncbi:uncharacterized protein LOC104883855 [Beta vulgaris subsp. vulgaris]|uniref:uncharacterized protein LOC104883855 n=1 Tax=Beta vulgaris subsp. vulgaris TaxID=3555 RepID=UPI00203676D8|nr:uncharacterized protein LOC104883855 [Beta vulgaris subsp. vulgaris]